MSRRTYQITHCCSRRRPFDLPQNASATAMPIIGEARSAKINIFQHPARVPKGSTGAEQLVVGMKAL